MKRSSFDSLEFEAFVAGETRIIHNMLSKEDYSGVGHLTVLTLISHWYGKTKKLVFGLVIV